MPLAFDSISHGTIAFGFFNIDSDMLLLDHYFFFAPEFCRYISGIAGSDGKDLREIFWQVCYVDDSKDIGDLMGAIHGIRHTGFIGEVYMRFPFPQRPEDFKQKPDGHKNRSIVEGIIGKYAESRQIPFRIEKWTLKTSIGVYRFTRESFQELIKYVWVGGMPRWKDGIRPDYVLNMKKEICLSRNEIFKGIFFEE